ncbi:MAG: class B sortase, partial [Clostridia bacterium]|nr:class B sortase [Clostridia bacterium]
MLRKLLFTLIAASFLLSAALAEPEATLEPLLPAEESAAFVEAMFRAATGVTKEGEWEYREGMSLEQRLKRNEECADYRARTLPWLEAALLPYEADALPTPEPTATPEITDEPEIVYTTTDSWAAFYQTELGNAFLERLAALGAQDEESALALYRRIKQEWLAQVYHAKLREMNADYQLWLYAPGTQIDYPVVQDEGNDFYLSHLFNGDRNAAGTLFADYRNQPGLLDPNTILYGHHMRNDSMFGTLTDYEDQEYYEANPYMLVYSEDEIALLEIIAGYTT